MSEFKFLVFAKVCFLVAIAAHWCIKLLMNSFWNLFNYWLPNFRDYFCQFIQPKSCDFCLKLFTWSHIFFVFFIKKIYVYEIAKCEKWAFKLFDVLILKFWNNLLCNQMGCQNFRLSSINILCFGNESVIRQIL